MKTGEARVKSDVKDYLTVLGAYFFMPVQGGYGKPTLDFLVCYKGQFIGIECKSPYKKRVGTPRQEKIMQDICAAGGRCWVINHIDQMDAIL